jgi:ribonuclease BN (tRNA processing enzyme)
VKATVRGCRGSLAAPGTGTVGYGGNTACLALVLADDTPLILDAGTGIRLLGLELARAFPRLIHILLTHLHLDHLEGLGLFAPIWMPGRSCTSGGRRRRSPAWPSGSPATSRRRSFRCSSRRCRRSRLPDLPAEEFRIGSATVLAQPVTHRGPTVGVRVDDADRSVAYPRPRALLGLEPEEAEPGWLSGYALAAEVGTLIHDAQYSEAEYRRRRGFGHSSVAHAVAFARAVNASQLILFHHDPLHSDGELDALGTRARELWADTRRPPTRPRRTTRPDPASPGSRVVARTRAGRGRSREPSSLAARLVRATRELAGDMLRRSALRGCEVARQGWPIDQ